MANRPYNAIRASSAETSSAQKPVLREEKRRLSFLAIFLAGALRRVGSSPIAAGLNSPRDYVIPKSVNETASPTLRPASARKLKDPRLRIDRWMNWASPLSCQVSQRATLSRGKRLFGELNIRNISRVIRPETSTREPVPLKSSNVIYLIDTRRFDFSLVLDRSPRRIRNGIKSCEMRIINRAYRQVHRLLPLQQLINFLLFRKQIAEFIYLKRGFTRDKIKSPSFVNDPSGWRRNHRTLEIGSKKSICAPVIISLYILHRESLRLHSLRLHFRIRDKWKVEISPSIGQVLVSSASLPLHSPGCLLARANTKSYASVWS